MPIAMSRLSLWVIMGLLMLSLFLMLQEKTPVTAPEAPAAIVITDNAGRRVQLPGQPRRVIVLNASNLDLFYAAGGKVIGKPTTKALREEVSRAFAAVPEVGTTANPSIEQMIAMEPDLILGVNAPPHHALLPVLEKAGIPILLQTLENYQQILDTLRLYGSLTGNPQLARSEVAKIETQYQEVMSRIKGKTAPRVLVVWGSTESFHMATQNSFAGDLVKRLGGINIADEWAGSGQLRNIPLSMEFVARANPEVILLITHSTDEKIVGKLRADLAKHPAWQGLAAVRNNRVEQLPYTLFAVNPGTRVGEALYILERLLYPGSDVRQ